MNSAGQQRKNGALLRPIHGMTIRERRIMPSELNLRRTSGFFNQHRTDRNYHDLLLKENPKRKIPRHDPQSHEQAHSSEAHAVVHQTARAQSSDPLRATTARVPPGVLQRKGAAIVVID